jgi:hypothetical protein
VGWGLSVLAVATVDVAAFISREDMDRARGDNKLAALVDAAVEVPWFLGLVSSTSQWWIQSTADIITRFIVLF